jgi:opacity protein-like surface antigen
MKKVFFLMIVVLATSLLSYGQDYPSWELFGGFQYLRLDVHDVQNDLNLLSLISGQPPLNFGNHLSAYGWNVSVQNNPTSWFGLVLDSSGVYGKKDINLDSLLGFPPSTTVTVRVKPSLYTVTFGPQFTVRKSHRVQPFGRVLLGVAYERSSGNSYINGVPVLASDLTQREKSFNFTAGGGFDYHFRDHLAFRTSADYVRTNFSSLTQNNLRVSVGLTYRLSGSWGLD